MTTEVQISAIRTTRDLPRDDNTFYMMDGEHMVACLQAPHRVDSDKRWFVMLYDTRRQDVGSRRTHTPMWWIKDHMRTMRNVRAELADMDAQPKRWTGETARQRVGGTFGS